MNMLKLIRYGAWAIVAAIVFVAGALALGWWQYCPSGFRDLDMFDVPAFWTRCSAGAMPAG